MHVKIRKFEKKSMEIRFEDHVTSHYIHKEYVQYVQKFLFRDIC